MVHSISRCAPARWCRAIFLGALLILPQVANALDCKDAKQLIDHYLRLHFSIHTFSEDLSRKTLTNFLKSWDPGKVYFLQEDIDGFNKRYATSLPALIEKSDCSAVDFIFNVYTKRFEERQAAIPKFIDLKHDFKIDEYLEIDRKTLPYAKTLEEVNERWRKRIKFQHMQLMTSVDSEAKIREKLHKRYELAGKRQKDTNPDDIYGMFLDAFSTSLDPHSDYFSPSQLEEFRISTRLSLEGIGALLRSEDGVTSIQSLVPGGAAQKSGLLKIDDKIVAVSQGVGTPVDVIDMDLRDVVKLIRGPGGTEVKLTIRRETKEFVAPIVREKVQLQDRAAKSKIYHVKSELPGDTGNYQIGVVDLPSFYMDFEGRQANAENFRSSSRDMKLELEKLKKAKVDAVIVDLRSNGGGSLDEAINVAGLFNGKGAVVQIKGANTKPYVSRYDGEAVYDGPLLLLIDRQSASASEILAGAIQDFERGLIVGDSHTFGKGTVQNLTDLEAKLGAIKVTISKFYLPAGSSTQMRGVPADITLPSISEHYEIGEKYYEYALPWEQVAAVGHNNFGAVKQYLTPLQLASSSRVKLSKDFKEVKEAIAKYEVNKIERSRVSLKEKSKAEKEKDAKELKEFEQREKDAPKDAFGNVIPQIKDDAYLQESVNIATDYVRLKAKLKLGRLKIAEVNVEPIAEAAPPSKGKADKAALKDKEAASKKKPQTEAKAPAAKK